MQFQERSIGNIPIAECTPGRVYQIQSRHLTFGVYDGEEGFIGIREKFGHRYLFTEYHWDQGPPHGTVSGQKDLGIDLPADISPKESLGIVDEETRRAVFFDRSVSQGGRGWVFCDTNEASEEIRPVEVPNHALFEFLERVQKEHH